MHLNIHWTLSKYAHHQFHATQCQVPNNMYNVHTKTKISNVTNILRAFLSLWEPFYLIPLLPIDKYTDIQIYKYIPINKRSHAQLIRKNITSIASCGAKNVHI